MHDRLVGLDTEDGLIQLDVVNDLTRDISHRNLHSTAPLISLMANG